MASDLISREALKEWIGCDGDNKYKSQIIHEIADLIDEVPAVDAVEVVRCKDCMYWTRVGKHTGKCPFLIGEHQYAGDDHYCSCGERGEEDGANS